MIVFTRRLKRPFSVVCLLAFFAQQTRAADFNVDNALDSGGGSLRAAIINSNATPALNSIFWTAGAGGTLTLAGDLAVLNDGTTLDVSSAATAVTIAGAPNALSLGGAAILRNDVIARDFSISASVGGNGSLIKTGAGKLNFTGVNTYAGGTFLNAGTLSANADAALGAAAGGLTFNGGTLQAGGALTSSRAVKLNSAATFDANNKISTFSGLITGAGSLIVTDTAGGGTLTLSGANTYSGGTIVSGTVNVAAGAANVFGSGAIVLNSGAGHADLNLAAFNQTIGSLTGDANSTLQLGAAQLTTGSDNSNTAFAGVISGAAGSLVKTGGGVWTLTRANTFGGGTTVNAGTLSIDNLNELGTGAVTLNGGALRTNVALAFARDIALGAAGGTIDTGGNDATFSGIFSGAGLTKTGAGTLTATGINTHTGGTTINQGVLSVGAENNLGALAGGLTFGGGTLKTTAGLADARTVALNSGGGTLDANGLTSTFSGVFANGASAGRLTIADSAAGGKIILTNANTYTGGTTLNGGTLSVANDNNLGAAAGTLSFNGGTLQTTTGITSARNVTINGLGAVIDTQNLNSTLSGSINGSGALAELGSGTLFLTGSNSYSGGTTLNTGTLSLSNDFALGTGALNFNGAGKIQTPYSINLANAVALTANGTFDTLGATTTLSGIISGAGSLSMISSGTLHLTGVNTYTGGTTISAGVLRINKGSGLGTGTLTLNGGTLQANANFTAINAITLGAGNGTIDTQSANATILGTISGAGSLTKLGTGVLTLGAANAYTGGTIVNAGTLALGIDNALAAVGALTVNSNATFDLANFTQTAASWNGVGTMKMTMRPAVTSLAVTGNAALSGPLAINLTPRVVLAGDTFMPITYGSKTGVFSGITSPAAVSFTPTYNANNVVLTASLVPFANSAANVNQSAIGNALEVLRVNPTGDAGTVLGNLYTLDAPHLQAAMDRIGPISLASMNGISMAASGAQSTAVGQRMAAIADGSSQKSRVANYLVSKPAPYPGTLLAYNGNDLSGLEMSDADKNRGTGSPWGFFASAVGTTGRLTEANGSSGSQPGYAFNTGGLTAGADYRLDEHYAVGASAGYLKGHASIYAPASGTVDSNSARFGLYGTGFAENFRASGYIGGAADFYKTRRDVSFPGISRTAAAAPKGTELNANASASYDFKTSAWGTFSPFAGLNYDRTMIGSFSETGADALDLNVAEQTAQSLQSSLGLRVSNTFHGEAYSWKPYLSAGWRHQFQNPMRPIDAELASGGGKFSVTTGNFARNGALLGTGFLMLLSNQTSVRLDYAGDFRSHFQENTVNALLRFKF